MPHTSEAHFIKQQGFSESTVAACANPFSSLMFQPRVTAVAVAIGLITQSWQIFLVLAVVLAWSVAMPQWNPFDAVYNAIVGRTRGLGPAPAPRRFAQGMAGAFMLAIALSLMSGNQVLAWVFEGFLVLALGALVFGRFCLGSYLYHLVTGNGALANETLPWAK